MSSTISSIDEVKISALRKALVEAAAVSTGVAAGQWGATDALKRLNAVVTKLHAVLDLVEDKKEGKKVAKG